MANKFGEIIIGNKRKGAELIPGKFVQISVDREHPVLGNRHILFDWRDDEERAEVLDDYKVDYDSDCATNGPMLEATKVIARRVYKGESVALMCWCKGAPTYKPCHAEFIRDKIEEILKPYRN